MDLFKAYDYLPQNILIAKLQAYWGNYNIVTFALVYLTSRKQRTKIATLIATGQKFFREYHKACLRPIIVQHIYQWHFLNFFEKSEVSNFADDTLPYRGSSPNQKIF